LSSAPTSGADLTIVDGASFDIERVFFIINCLKLTESPTSLRVIVWVFGETAEFA
jgi:hypothetical protein